MYGDRGPVRQRQPAAAKTAADVAETQRVAVGLSSVSAGDGDPEPFSEDHPASNPLSPYAASKRSAELVRGFPPACSRPSAPTASLSRLTTG